MLAEGNGEPQVCAMNLLRTVRGEVPMDRTKGIDREYIDGPASRAPEMQADAEWVLETYEPRIDPEDVRVAPGGEGPGDFELMASTLQGEDEE